jgi:hypothetical protein
MTIAAISPATPPAPPVPPVPATLPAPPAPSPPGMPRDLADVLAATAEGVAAWRDRADGRAAIAQLLWAAGRELREARAEAAMLRAANEALLDELDQERNRQGEA